MDSGFRRWLGLLLLPVDSFGTGCGPLLGTRLPGPLGDRLGPTWRYIPADPSKNGRYERAYEEFFAAGEYLQVAPYAHRGAAGGNR